ncbi:MAG: hypothetical protein GY812_02455, partial [Actinomycetia bacterium]|nr:hypothetical protein [Actinomycetes bacterium]
MSDIEDPTGEALVEGADIGAGLDEPRRRRSLIGSSVAPAVGTALSRATGLLRVSALTAALGLTSVADTYNLANTTPNILYELVLGGVLSSTLVPLFIHGDKTGGDKTGGDKTGGDDPGDDDPGDDDPGDDDPGDTASALMTVAFVAVTVLSVL